MRIATWNINSVRLRKNLVRRLLRDKGPDVLCLQETKTIDGLFPGKAFAELGYEHQAIAGQKGYHGVAILSRVPFVESRADRYCDNDDCRHMRVNFENGIELHNFYVPAGGDIPDPAVNVKFAHKLAFLREMAANFAKRTDRATAKVVIVGDLNVAPLEHDVWSHKQLLRIVSHTPVETGLLADVKTAFDFTDVTREFVPENENIYSWWSYRAADWRAADRGRRLDHIWVSRALKDRLSDHEILKAARGWKQPSDHVPVLVNVEA
jgi:exodeoxyribonuclease-3